MLKYKNYENNFESLFIGTKLKLFVTFFFVLFFHINMITILNQSNRRDASVRLFVH